MSTRRPWTDTERALLRELYADTPTAVIAARLGRSVGTVFTAAYNGAYGEKTINGRPVLFEPRKEGCE